MAIELPDGVSLTQDQLDRAEREVLYATRSALYTTDEQGVATDPKLLAAFQDAITIQAYAIACADEEVEQAQAVVSPLGRPLQSASIGGVSYTAADGPQGYAGLHLAVYGALCGDAYSILQAAGLLSGRTWVYG